MPADAISRAVSPLQAKPVLEVVGVAKSYGHIRALEGVTLDIHAGEVVGLVGDNGAGKSTLVNIIAGAIRPSAGTLRIEGREVAFASALDARTAGIEAVYQDLALALDLDIWANIFLGRETLRPGLLGRLGWLDKRAMQRRAAEELGRTAIRVGSIRTRCRALSGGQRQAVAVARGLIWGSRLLLLDEPTAALGVEQQAKVGKLIEAVRARGIPVILVSHNMPQVHDLCDRIVVLFQGRKIADRPASDMTIADIIACITGAGITGTREMHA
ncbi:ATP-binding cassette domain-containing protein [Acidiphilium sp. AL]|uniref:ATP-binding cassette domain-containing protein n=1 Tax=Acidiphilium iwatense TaxID=768198 RepID=A0ABS9DU77_9PROT|nr:MULTISPECIES: ATP-binding cassette domain-containing protein [Acidiphilium]MCF3946283.1 ATP-binding cassette domain-containing protein [Acidiphilium iwatense]MCU4158855.1 ATP-binding cassette domain-containing protein [Acidiphilium sp. AL]